MSKLSGPIKDFLNSVSANNQVIGVNLALQNGYTAEDIALYVLNTCTQWKQHTFVVARGLIRIYWEKSFLGKKIKLRIELGIEEPFSTEFSIRLNDQCRGWFAAQYRALECRHNECIAPLILDGLIELIESEVFEPAWI